MDEDVADFHRKFGHPAPSSPKVPEKSVLDFRINLIREECDELCEAIEAGDLGQIAAEAVDVVYVVLGTLVVCGLRIAPFWAEVQQANMAKVPNPEGGKPLKPDGWRKPDCDRIIGRWQQEERMTRFQKAEDRSCFGIWILIITGFTALCVGIIVGLFRALNL